MHFPDKPNEPRTQVVTGRGIVLSYQAAIALLRKPERKLIVTHTARGPEYSIVPGGGRVAPTVVPHLLRRCRVCDAGLFPGLAQTWCLKNT